MEKDKIAERIHYRKSVARNRYSCMTHRVEEQGYAGDDEDSDGSDICEDWSFDPDKWGPIPDFPYDVYYGSGW